MRVESIKRHYSSVLGSSVYNRICGSDLRLRARILPYQAALEYEAFI